LVLTALTAGAQNGAVGNRQGWTVDVSEDAFSGKKDYHCFYYDQQKVLGAVYYPESGFLTVIDWFDGKLYFDVSFDAVMDNRGHIAKEQIDYEWRIAQVNGEADEDFGTVAMKYGDVKRAGETFFGTFIFDADADAMMSGQSIAVRWKDPIKGKKLVRKISLMGFTRCYDEVLRRYEANRKK
jgi:hypothetical protein